MSFFEREASSETPPPETEPQQQRVVPDWFEPPRGVVPGQSTQHVVLFGTDRALLTIRHFEVYKTGVEFLIDLQVKPNSYDLYETPWELQSRSRRHQRSLDDLPDEFLRLGFSFADGTTWTNLAHTYPKFDETPEQPVIIGRGGGGGGDRWSMGYWMWPLPPAGDVVVHAAWPLFDVDEVSAVIDGTELRQQAEHVQRFWT